MLILPPLEKNAKKPQKGIVNREYIYFQHSTTHLKPSPHISPSSSTMSSSVAICLRLSFCCCCLSFLVLICGVTGVIGLIGMYGLYGVARPAENNAAVLGCRPNADIGARPPGRNLSRLGLRKVVFDPPGLIIWLGADGRPGDVRPVIPGDIGGG